MKFILSIAIFLLGCTTAFAASGSNSSSSSNYKDAKHQVDVMLLMDKIYNINLSSSTYDIEAEIILKWTDHE